MKKAIESIELPDGNVFIITKELMTRSTALGRLVRNYMEKSKAANSDDEKYEAIRNMFLSIFNEIDAGNDNLRFEFRTTLMRNKFLANSTC
ncbi:MAG: hypothetical protein PHO01_07620 [Desulfotomaculaceae bacterium]|nr:hypothetical protein [Desulfotomaculaceae bacterium]